MKCSFKKLILIAIFFIFMLFSITCASPSTENPIHIPKDENLSIEKLSVQPAAPGETIYTHINSPENGSIAVRVDIPQHPRFGDQVPIVVVASTWFVDKYNLEETPFHLEFNPVKYGLLVITHLWPGKTDPDSGVSSAGQYDFGGPDSIAALRDTINFALGKTADVDGNYLNDLIQPEPLYNNVGLFASSHAGVVATNVMAYHGESFPELKYFVGRENPTMAEMYPLEIGHFNTGHKPIYNPYYDPQAYTPTTLSVDYSHLTWIQNDTFLEGRPVFIVPNGRDYVLDDKGPNIDGKRWFSHSLTQALWENGVFLENNWPSDVATPEETAEFWPYRETINNYGAIGDKLPELRVMLPFASYDHVQTAPDKPHIRQAYDGFHKTAGLWTRLNCDLSYVQSEVHPSASQENGFPDHPANTEPRNWSIEAESWGFEGRLAGELTAKTVPLACVVEMAERVWADNWQPDLDAPLF